jgi:hypothetical protein
MNRALTDEELRQVNRCYQMVLARQQAEALGALEASEEERLRLERAWRRACAVRLALEMGPVVPEIGVRAHLSGSVAQETLLT